MADSAVPASSPTSPLSPQTVKNQAVPRPCLSQGWVGGTRLLPPNNCSWSAQPRPNPPPHQPPPPRRTTVVHPRCTASGRGAVWERPSRSHNIMTSSCRAAQIPISERPARLDFTHGKRKKSAGARCSK